MTRHRRTIVCALALLVAASIVLASWRAVVAVDPAIQIEQTDLYRDDFFELPLEGGAVASQDFRGAGVARIDVMASSRERGELSMVLRAENGTEIQEDVAVETDGEMTFTVFVFDMTSIDEQDFDVEFRSDDDVSVYGSTCDCFDSGDGRYEGGGGSSIRDLHLGTFTVMSLTDRGRLLLDRVGAYAPSPLGPLLVAAALVLALVAGSLVGAVMLSSAIAGRRSATAIVICVTALLLPTFVIQLLG